MNTENIIIYIVIAFAVCVIIYTVYKREDFEGTLSEYDIPLDNIPNETQEEKAQTPRLLDSGSNMDFHRAIPIDQVTPNCRITQQDQNTQDYITKHLLGTGELAGETCALKPQTAKQFHKDFYSFRDKTCHNSSEKPDSVDFISQLYLQGNTETARMYPNMKIQDLFDEATKAGRPNLYERSCVRLPTFDNINPEQWTYHTGNPATQLVADEYKYPSENVNNGGNYMGSIKAIDPMESHLGLARVH